MIKQKRFMRYQFMILAIMATAFMHEATAGSSGVWGCVDMTRFNTAYLTEGIRYGFSIRPNGGGKMVHFTLGKTKIKHGFYGGMAWNTLTPEDMTHHQTYLRMLLSAAESRRLVTVSWVKSGPKKNLVVGTIVHWNGSCKN